MDNIKDHVLPINYRGAFGWHNAGNHRVGNLRGIVRKFRLGLCQKLHVIATRHDDIIFKAGRNSNLLYPVDSHAKHHLVLRHDTWC